MMIHFNIDCCNSFQDKLKRNAKVILNYILIFRIKPFLQNILKHNFKSIL